MIGVSGRSRLEECPFCATRAAVCGQKEMTMARKRKKDTKANNSMMPVMRPDAAGIDIGATEIFVAVPVDRAAENVRSFPTFTQDLYAKIAPGGVAGLNPERVGPIIPARGTRFFM